MLKTITHFAYTPELICKYLNAYWINKNQPPQYYPEEIINITMSDIGVLEVNLRSKGLFPEETTMYIDIRCEGVFNKFKELSKD